MTVDEICEYIGADSLAFLSQEGLIDSIGLKFDMPYSGLCMDSFNGDYPTGLYDYEGGLREQYDSYPKRESKGRTSLMENAYAKAGVDVTAGYETVSRIKKHIDRTKRPGVFGEVGGFGGNFDLSELNYKKPVLVSGTDGVGTKLMLAIEAGKFDTIGIDCVAMCVNDVVAQGRRTSLLLGLCSCRKKPSGKTGADRCWRS